MLGAAAVVDDDADARVGYGHPRPDSAGREAKGEAAELVVGMACSGAAQDGGDWRGNGGGSTAHGELDREELGLGFQRERGRSEGARAAVELLIHPGSAGASWCVEDGGERSVATAMVSLQRGEDGTLRITPCLSFPFLFLFL